MAQKIIKITAIVYNKLLIIVCFLVYKIEYDKYKLIALFLPSG
jgi:hypothetical protein